MRVRFLSLYLILAFGSCLSLRAASAEIYKVLPFYLDSEGRHALSPSLYERDAYQALLRQHPEKRAGLLFDVQWKARHTHSNALILRIELRSTGHASADPFVIDRPVRPGFFSRWTSLRLPKEEYQNFGQLTAWRASLWSGGEMIAEQKSFLW